MSSDKSEPIAAVAQRFQIRTLPNFSTNHRKIANFPATFRKSFLDRLTKIHTVRVSV